jgi:hypothetical protein
LSEVFVEQAAEPVSPVHPVPRLARDGWTDRWIGRLQPERSVGTVGIVVLDVALLHLSITETGVLHQRTWTPSALPRIDRFEHF